MATTEHSHDHGNDHDHDHDHAEARRPSKKELEREARARAREMVARSQIRQYPDPVLREPARPVSEFSDDLRALVKRMITLMDDANGVGLAGNQVGLVRRVLVYRPGTARMPSRGRSSTPSSRSAPRRRPPTRRAACRSGRCACRSSAACASPWTPGTRTASRCTWTPTRLEARILQHEIDHLDGVLTIDRTSPEARREALAALRPEPGARR